jgi:hypothetical protein
VNTRAWHSLGQPPADVSVVSVGWLDRFRGSTSDRQRGQSTLLLLTAGQGELPEGSVVLEEDLVLDLVGVTDYEGRPALPAFTSESTLLRWRPEGSPYIEVPAAVAAQLLLQGEWERIVVDPDMDDAYEITRSEATAFSGT